MDGKLCLWDVHRSTCKDIRSHMGSITKVIADPIYDVAFSAGYDGDVPCHCFVIYFTKFQAKYTRTDLASLQEGQDGIQR